jgi:hypothetical protein
MDKHWTPIAVKATINLVEKDNRFSDLLKLKKNFAD